MPPRPEEEPDLTPPRRGKGRGRQGGASGGGSGRTASSSSPKSSGSKAGSSQRGKSRSKRSPKGEGARSASPRRGSKELHGPSLFDAVTRANGLRLWLIALVLWVALLLYPVSDASTRTLSLILLAGLTLGGLGLIWRYPWVRWPLLALYLLLAGYWFLPGRTSFDRPALRDETAQSLAAYEGVRFWPEGENQWGVDGPGLVRRGLMEAMFRHGVKTLNPWLLRRSFSFWQNDLTLRELAPSARGQARRYTIARSLGELNPDVLYPGDFAVTRDHSEVFTYLGDHRWLLPDAESGRVIVIDPRSTTHPAASKAVSHMRWRILEAPRPHSVYLP